MVVAPGSARARQTAATRPTAAGKVEKPWWLRPPHDRSRVVEIRSRRALNGSVVNAPVLAEVFSRGLRALTGVRTEREAWKTVLGSARRIVIKFNAVGAEVISTTDAMARALVAGVVDAGYEAERVALVEAPGYLTTEYGLRIAARGWGGAIRVGESREELANYLLEADAVVNVAFLKTHRIAGMSGCLKNLSHAVIRHPAKYHANGCSPYVGQVVSSKEVTSRLKLNITNATRIVFRNGPDARNEDLSNYGALLLAYDPVAVDAVGLEILELERRRLGETERVFAEHIGSAAKLAVGRRQPAELQRLLLDDGG